MSPKKTPTNATEKLNYKNIPTALLPSHIRDIDEIAKIEKMTRSEIIRRAIETFTFNYKNDVLDQRQLQLEKRMETMEKAMRGLLVKSIRISGQNLYFNCLPYTKGIPKQRLTNKAFQDLYDKSGTFAAQFLDSTAAAKPPKYAMLLEDEPAGEAE